MYMELVESIKGSIGKGCLQQWWLMHNYLEKKVNAATSPY